MPFKDPEKRRAYVAQWSKDHPEKTRVSNIAWNKKHPEQRAAINAAWVKAHPEKRHTAVARWRTIHTEAIKAKARVAYAANPSKDSEKAQRRRARKANAPINDFTAAQWEMIKAQYGHRCVYCGRKMKRLTQDHITPLFKGASHTLSNILPACQSCNSKKGRGNVLVPVQLLLL